MHSCESASCVVVVVVVFIKIGLSVVTRATEAEMNIATRTTTIYTIEHNRLKRSEVLRSMVL